MGVSYNKLFKLMIDRKMRKGELCKAAGISSGSLLKYQKMKTYMSIFWFGFAVFWAATSATSWSMFLMKMPL